MNLIKLTKFGSKIPFSINSDRVQVVSPHPDQGTLIELDSTAVVVEESYDEVLQKLKNNHQ